MKRDSIIIITGFFVFFLLALISSLSMAGYNVFGWNNMSTTTKLYVWNTEPNITGVTISPDPIDLSPGNTTTINCSANVWDYNGWNDVEVSNATFFHISVNDNSPDNNNNHYTVEDTENNCSCGQIDANNATCWCLFDVWYYATNGTWTCNMTITDTGGEATEREYYFNVSDSNTATVNTVTAIDVPLEIDYGNLSVTETSEEMPANVTNFGNVPVNISIRGYGGTTDPTNPNNLAMECDYGSISIEYEKYSRQSGVDYGAMATLTNISTPMQLKIPVRTNDEDYGDSTNATYWKIQIPLSVGGHCNGTLEFVGHADW
ncbi:MAG: hypothetical protein PHV16_03395 [Candidatus Nanoarchaeia archaeon]|nr:hypothetical protein [Candidatus Nanoarchaeia archaeon]